MKERQPSRKDAILVSICCITYNHEEFIRDCIEGFLMQETDFPMEIIIHDDASTDRTPEIVREYAAKYPDLIFPIFQKENQFSKGRKPLINLTLPHAKGKYIAVCEGDDYWTDPHKLRKQVDFLESHPDYISCYHDAMIVDEDGNIVKPSKLPDNFKKDFSPEEISKGAWILTLTQCFRNVLKNIPSEVEHVYNGDTFFNSLLGNFGRGKYMADIAPAVYRLHPNSIWSILDESDKMYHGGVTRAWMYRYYKRIGQHQYAEHYKNLAIEHFCRMLKILAPNHGAQHNDIINNISNQFADIIEGTSGSNLRKLLKRTQFLTGIENKEAPAMSSFSHESPSQQQTSIDGPGNSDKKINRILFVNHNIYPYEVSGTPLTTLNHAVGMAQRGFEVAVLIPSPKVKNGFTKESSSDFTLYQVPAMDKFDAYFSAIDEDSQSRYMETIEGIIDDFSPQIVHINDYVYMPSEIIEVFSRKGCIVVREVCNCEELCHRDYPVIASGLNGQLCTGPEKPNKCAKCFQTLSASATRKHNRKETARSIADKIETRFEHVRRLYQDAVDKVLFTSEPFKNYFTQFVPVAENKIAVIPRGFQFDYTRRVNHERETGDAIHFAFIGNIMFSKGIDVVLKAFEKIVGEYRNFVLHLYGNIVNPEYRQWIGELQRSFPNRLINHGPFNKDSLPTIADGIDVCIIPSYFDTYNRVLREILYLGIPVIVTDFFGAYIVEDGKNGFKIPIGDDEALAQKMADIIDNPSMIKHLSRGAENTQIPSLEQEIDQLVETYNDLYNQSPRARCLQRAKSIKTVESQGSHIDTATRLIAFYLPQYHPIPENDRWWGKGFTEWTNTAKAKPLFPGHYQPHVPSDLGYYDLRLAETRNAQAELAREHGISGFCYYHYWFNGKLLLDYPLDQVLKTGEPDFPFCLCWANENWTRAWDGRQGEVLIEQHYSEDDHRNHIRWLLDVFQDRRYIRVNGKPLMLVYLSKSIPRTARAMEIWREEAERNGQELYLCKVESAPWEYENPSLSGFDAAVEFQPDWGNLGKASRQLPNGHMAFDYPSLVERTLNKPTPPYKRFPCVMPMWDNSPRRKQAAVIFENSTPEQYERWLSSVVSNLGAHNLDAPFVFINAWNEWGEGNHLEPDEKHGRAYLEATKRALSTAEGRFPAAEPGPVSIVILSFNGLEYTKQCVQSIQEHTPEPHEIIFVDNGSTDGTVQWLRTLAEEHSNYRLIENEHNLGFARGCNQGIEAAEGAYILLLNNDVIVTQGWLSCMLRHLNSSDDIGMVGPMSNSVSGPQLVEKVPYGSSMDAMQKFARNRSSRYSGETTEHMRLVGFCLLVKKEVLDIIGGLDENYNSGNFEDDDLCLRSFIAGYKNIIAHDVFIHHFGSMTFKGNAIDYQASMNDNLKYFSGKWKGFAEASENGYRITLTRQQQLGLLLQWGEERFSQGDMHAAIKIFKRVLLLDRKNSQALNNLGVIQWQLGDMPASLDTFQVALRINPEDSDALGNLVQGVIETERFDLLQQDLLDTLRQKHPAHPDVVRLFTAQQNAAGAT